MKPRKPIRRVSAKRAAALKIYQVERTAYLSEIMVCECNMGETGCTGLAQEIHHRCGRGPYLNDVSTWMAVCRPCHLFIHSHPSWARDWGYICKKP